MVRKLGRDWAAILADAKKRGVSQAVVSREQNVSNNAVSRRCKERGVTLPREPSVLARADWPVVLRAARANGMSQSDVGRAQGVSNVAVHKHCKRLGIDLPHGNSFGRGAR
jgi:hypothetical protein